ncbi:G5 domain-containing protein [Couchioplanes caeruleus]|uniref:G5 domain-containing protein n=1 Tax=Couchioplanes caeruleus TaxID=56438 RepID=UPI0020BE5E6E|nr:G5 domain-containing protein [Couchioplanes caeruleus]UQU65826.1 G5 domain-containing protein [Couchioplanes caeruleus]
MANQTSMWSRLKTWHKAGLIVAALAVAGGSALALTAAFGGDEPAQVVGRVEQPVAQPSGSGTAEAAETQTVAGKQKRTEKKTEPIKFKTRTVKDNWLPKGTKEKRTEGIDGVRTRTYEVVLVDGKETSRKLIKNEVTRKPVDEVIAVGSY